MTQKTVVAAPDTRPSLPLPLAQREVALLLVLGLISMGLFFATRRMAEWSRDNARREAAVWYAEGRQRLDAGQAEGAIVLLRRATAKDAANPGYQLVLARALATAGHDLEARTILQRLRENQPDSAEINYRLARLAVRTGDSAEAVRYYHLAIYSLAPADPQYDRPHVRLELAGYLIEHGDRRGAIAELDAVQDDLPDNAASHVQVAALFERAGDTARAFDAYARAVKLDPSDASAIAGAGRTATALHDDEDARRLLRAMVQQAETGRRTAGGR